MYPCFYSQPPPLTPGLSPWGSRFISPSLHSYQEALQDGSQPQPNNNPHCHKQRLETLNRPLLSARKHAEGMLASEQACRLSPSSFHISLSELPYVCARFLPFRRASVPPLAICVETMLNLIKEKQKKLGMVSSCPLISLYMQHIACLMSWSILLLSFYIVFFPPFNSSTCKSI